MFLAHSSRGRFLASKWAWFAHRHCPWSFSHVCQVAATAPARNEWGGVPDGASEGCSSILILLPYRSRSAFPASGFADRTPYYSPIYPRTRVQTHTHSFTLSDQASAWKQKKKMDLLSLPRPEAGSLLSSIWANRDWTTEIITLWRKSLILITDKM